MSKGNKLRGKKYMIEVKREKRKKKRKKCIYIIRNIGEEKVKNIKDK